MHTGIEINVIKKGPRTLISPKFHKPYNLVIEEDEGNNSYAVNQNGREIMQ